MNYCEKVRTTQENSDLWGTIARSAAKLTALDPKLAMTIMASFSEDLATSNNSYERDAERLRVQYGSDIEAAEDAQKDALKEAYTFRLYDCQDELERATGEIFGRELDRIDEAITIAERQQKS